MNLRQLEVYFQHDQPQWNHFTYVDSQHYYLVQHCFLCKFAILEIGGQRQSNLMSLLNPNFNLFSDMETWIDLDFMCDE